MASGSPRRAELLRSRGVSFIIVVPGVEEEALAGEQPEDHVRRLAYAKAAAVAAKFPDRAVLGADTAVIVNDRILGKPVDDDEARAMLRTLQGRSHRVLTGWTVLAAGGSWAGVAESVVHMRPLVSEEIERYINLGEHRDKAGAYAAQGIGARLIERIEGSFSNVVGLPLEPIGPVLAKLGYGLDGPPISNGTRA